MYGKRNMETYITICKIDSQWEFAVWLKKLKPQFNTVVLNVLGVVQFSSVQLLSHVRLFATPRIAARQASLSITNTRSSPKLRSIELVMPSSHVILCHPLLLQPSISPSIRVFSSELTLRMR